MTSVSVVMPCYRYGHFLDEAVRSVLDDQPGVDVRLLIIDDASPDDSADVARRIAAADPRVEVLVHETNKGHVLVTIGNDTETFEPPRHKDLDVEQMANLRRLLKKAGYGPDDGS